MCSSDLIRDTGSDRRLQGPLVVEGDTPAVAGAFTEDGCYFAATYASGVIRVWEVERPQATLEGDGQIRSTALDARRVRLVVTLGADARLLSRATVAPIVSITFEEGEALLVARDATGFARMWEWRLSEEAPQLGTGAGPVLPVTGVNALLYADDHLYTAWDDGFVRSFQLATGVQDAMLLGHAGAVTSLAVSADAATLVTGSADGTVRTWSTATGVQKLAFNTFADPVRRVALSPEGFRAAAIGDDKVLRTWDATKGKALRQIGRAHV